MDPEKKFRSRHGSKMRSQRELDFKVQRLNHSATTVDREGSFSCYTNKMSIFCLSIGLTMGSCFFHLDHLRFGFAIQRRDGLSCSHSTNCIPRTRAENR